jgi:hypothetical protein
MTGHATIQASDDPRCHSTGRGQPSSTRELGGASISFRRERAPSRRFMDASRAVVKARHKTFYGSTELYVREPGGNTVGFARF